jgi:hypothetical protein
MHCLKLGKLDFEQICDMSWPSNQALHRYYTKTLSCELDPKNGSTTLETVDGSEW